MTRYAFDGVGAYCIDAIPNQPQVAHCHSFFIHAHHRGHGHAERMKRDQCQKLYELGFNFATCTTVATNTRQIRVLERCGWVPLTKFKNSQADGETVLWGWAVE